MRGVDGISTRTVRSDQCCAGFHSQADRKELLVIFQSVLFLIGNLWPCRYQEMGLQNFYFTSHTMLRKEGEKADRADLISAIFYDGLF